ncbi:MAG: ORC1-type DNA replication protein [bacterium]|nr:ORC1-type DNA replication protein [bacterium]
MGEKELVNFFENFLDKESLFTNKQVLQVSYLPEDVIHRNEQRKQMAAILAPALKLEKPSNLFIYGKTGTGKTVSTKNIINDILHVSKKNNTPLKVIYINCKLKKIADTEYRLIAQLARECGKSIPATGLPTDEVYKIFYDTIEKEKQMVIIVLDEIDQLVKKTGDSILYNLTRIHEELKKSQIALVGISNDMVFIDSIDPRVKSSLSEEEVVFPPYNAPELQDILRQRANNAFKGEVIEEGVIEKCAAYAAREHGDARRALELLRVAGEIAERNNFLKIKLSHIDDAENKMERDRLLDILKTQPKQVQAVLYSIVSISAKKKNQIFTGEVYEFYKNVCSRTDLRPLTQRRISDVIAELDMLGIINVRVISKGRYGRTREISLEIPHTTAPKIKRLLEDTLQV